MRYPRVFMRSAPAALLGLALAAPARGSDYTWDTGDGVWNSDPFKWDPLGLPDDDDRAIFDLNVSVDLTNADEEVRWLRMSDGVELDLNGNDLTVNGAGFPDIEDIGVIVDGPGTNLVVPENSLLTARQVVVQNGAALDLRGGELLIDEQGVAALLITAGASLNGHGRVDVDSSTALFGGILNNNGIISASFAAPGDLGGESAGGIVIAGLDSGTRWIDLDGELESGQVFISRNDALQTSLPLNDPFSGVMTLSAGANYYTYRSWNFDGELIVNTQGLIMGTAGDAAHIGGPSGVELTQIGGEIILDPIGSLVIGCPFTMSGGTIDNRGSITFAGPTTISGNFLMGSTSRVIIHGTTTVFFANWNWDGDGGADNVIDIGDSGTLNANLQSAGMDDVWNGEMNIAGGTLNVQGTSDNWDNEGAINVGGTNPSVIGGDRLIQTAGTFHVLNPGSLDMNAASTWTGGTLEIDGTLRFNRAATLNGGAITGSGTLEFHQNASVDALTTIAMADGTTTFFAGSATTLVADLTVDNELTTVQVGADFSGGGALINEGTLQLADGIVATDFAVVVENRRTLQLGASPGQVQAGAFEQSAAGTWQLELGGVGANDYDRLSLTSVAVLDGTLELALIDGYVPALDQTLNILFAPGGVTGTFADVLQPAGMPLGLRFSVVYSPTGVQLQVGSSPAFSADFNHDGDVDAADLAQWQGDFGLNGDSDADSDNDSDGADFLAWQQQLGAASAVSGVIPEPSTWVLVSLAAAGKLKRRALAQRVS
jgi:hypothetical protein